MTKSQADEINNIFDSQKQRISDLKTEVQRLKSFKSLNSYNDSLTYKLDLIEYWIYWGAIDKCQLSFSEEKNTIKKTCPGGYVEYFPSLFVYPKQN
jgi:hypothetical protein